MGSNVEKKPFMKTHAAGRENTPRHNKQNPQLQTNKLKIKVKDVL